MSSRGPYGPISAHKQKHRPDPFLYYTQFPNNNASFPQISYDMTQQQQTNAEQYQILPQQLTHAIATLKRIVESNGPQDPRLNQNPIECNKHIEYGNQPEPELKSEDVYGSWGFEINNSTTFPQPTLTRLVTDQTINTQIFNSEEYKAYGHNPPVCGKCNKKDFSVSVRFNNCGCENRIICFDCFTKGNPRNCDGCGITGNYRLDLASAKIRDMIYGPYVCPRCNKDCLRVDLSQHIKTCSYKFCGKCKKSFPLVHFIECTCRKYVCKNSTRFHIDEECTELHGRDVGCHICCKKRILHSRNMQCAICETHLERCGLYIFPHDCNRLSRRTPDRDRDRDRR